jgi:hypothetical protein
MGPCSKRSKRTIHVLVRDKSGRGFVEAITVPPHPPKFPKPPDARVEAKPAPTPAAPPKQAARPRVARTPEQQAVVKLDAKDRPTGGDEGRWVCEACPPRARVAQIAATAADDADDPVEIAATPADMPLEYWQARFEIRDDMVVWRERPRENFPTEGEWRAWNERYAGKQPGGKARDGSVRLRDLGCYVSLAKVRIMLETGIWPGLSHGKPISGPRRSAN